MTENSLKAISKTTDDELRVGNYMVLFGGRDLEGEFFTKSTKFDSNYTDTGLLYVDFEHGRDAEKSGNSPDNVLGIVDWKTAKADDAGLFVERVLNRRASYIQGLMQLIDAGMIGTSSQAIPYRAKTKKSGEIVEWPLMRDSLTVAPMEPRMATENVLMAVKSLAEAFPASRTLAAITGKPIQTGKLPSLSEFEDFLRESGFSKSQATAIAGRGLKDLLSRSESGGKPGELLAALKSFSCQ